MGKWFKSSKSGAAGHCVDVKFEPDGVFVRNSRTLHTPIFYTFEEWSAFIAGVKLNEFDLPE
jgi:hypothetical protein